MSCWQCEAATSPYPPDHCVTHCSAVEAHTSEVTRAPGLTGGAAPRLSRIACVRFIARNTNLRATLPAGFTFPHDVVVSHGRTPDTGRHRQLASGFLMKCSWEDAWRGAQQLRCIQLLPSGRPGAMPHACRSCSLPGPPLAKSPPAHRPAIGGDKERGGRADRECQDESCGSLACVGTHQSRK